MRKRRWSEKYTEKEAQFAVLMKWRVKMSDEMKKQDLGVKKLGLS